MSRFLRRGFTLAEMLIVIAVIGILSSMMMVASSESVKTTRVSNIISTLRNFASAAMTFYTDSMDYFTKYPSYDKDIDNSAQLTGRVMKYMYNGGNSIQDKTSYKVVNNSGTWWVGYNVGSDSDSEALKTRLTNRADSANLIGSTGINAAPTKSDSTYPKYNGDPAVWLLIRSNSK